MSLQYNIALNNLKLIGALGKVGQLEAFNISIEDYRMLTSDIPWTQSDRNRMGNTLASLSYGALDRQGLPRFPITAEYWATVIAAFVAGINIMSACHYALPVGETDYFSRGKDSPTITPQQIFSLVTELYDTPERTNAKIAFERGCNIELSKALNKPKESNNAKNNL